jgi:predicted Zn finger-like uncharacterized protein
MILSCNSCEKRFVVPDQAISAMGRTVQCGSCGNKWKQFPIKKEINKIVSEKKINLKKSITVNKVIKPKRKNVKKTREINLYSPEYLEKKHGISLNNIKVKNSSNSHKKVSFGFYNSLILFIVAIIVLSKGLHFFESFIIDKFPFTKFYLDYFFESIKNIFEIWKNLISKY